MPSPIFPTIDASAFTAVATNNYNNVIGSNFGNNFTPLPGTYMELSQ